MAQLQSSTYSVPRLLVIWSQLRVELHVFVRSENHTAGYESGLKFYEARLVLISLCLGEWPNAPTFKLLSLCFV